MSTISDQLRDAIRKSGVSYMGIQRATGVDRQTVQRFVDGITNLRIDMADRLAEYFGLELKPKGKGQQ